MRMQQLIMKSRMLIKEDCGRVFSFMVMYMKTRISEQDWGVGCALDMYMFMSNLCLGKEQENNREEGCYFSRNEMHVTRDTVVVQVHTQTSKFLATSAP